MSDLVTKMAPIIWEKINIGNSFLLHCHPSPDPDSLGSALAFMHALESLGKKATLISGDSQLSPSFKFPGVERVVSSNYFNINIEQFDTFIILDSSTKSQISSLGEVVFPKHLTTIVIDHHSTNSGFGSVNLVEESYPATAQILFDLFSYWNITISPQIAACLLVGIYDDTLFKYSKTTFHTFEAAATLSRIYPDFPKLIFDLENNNTPGRVRFKGIVLMNAKTFFGSNVALSTISYEDLQRNNISISDTEKNDAENELKSVIGWNIGIKIVEKEKGKCIISFRTRDPGKFNVALLAKEITPSGGGHAVAAGCSIAASPKVAEKKLFSAVEKLFPELGQP